MANGDQSSFNYDPEKLGRKRFLDNKTYRANLNSRAGVILSALSDLIPSNYPKSENTNLGILYRVLAREETRLQQSIQEINLNKVYTETDVKYLHQILGERLYLGDKIAPQGYNDILYRDYLISIKDAYLRGSSVQSIEETANNFLQQSIRIKELYREARKPDSAYGLINTHMMVLDVFVDDLLSSGIDFGSMSTTLDFFINLIRPAHVLYDTNFIWTENFDVNKVHDFIFGDTGGGCVPQYLYTPFDEIVVLATQIMVVEHQVSTTVIGSTSTPSDNVFQIASIHSDNKIIYLANGTRVVVEPGITGTAIYDVNGKRMPFEHLKIGQWIRLVFLNIPGDFNFHWLPPDLVESYDSRFYKSVYRKPAFQEFVKKQMDSQGRFPIQTKTTPTTICDRWVQDALQPMYEDLRKNCYDQPEERKSYSVTLAERMWNPRFSWENIQGADLGREKTGDTYRFTMSHSPLTDGSSGPATPSDIGVVWDGTVLSNSVETVDASSAIIELYNTSEYWDSTYNGPPLVGDELTFNYDYLDSTAPLVDSTASTDFVYGISRWQLPEVPISNGDGSNILALPDDINVYVDGTYISDAVIELNPILGHVTLNSLVDFWTDSSLGRKPDVGDVIRFDYYQSGNTVYSMLWDDIARVFDDNMTFDGAEGATTTPDRAPAPQNDPLQIGYKFRTDLLHHASVLNSPDTLQLNNYQKPKNRASIINRQDTLNHFNYFFSPEHLKDTDPITELDDEYLNKDINPEIWLGPGTPPFQKTYSYQPDLIHHRKLKDVREHHHPLMYCDLLLKEYQTGDEEIPLSSICDQARYSFKIRFREEILNTLEECESWVLFDSAVIDPQDVSIPSIETGVINLRVLEKKLRSNFILRETEPTKIISHTHSVYVPIDENQTEFWLPETISYNLPEQPIQFPSLPVVKDYSTLAGPEDVVVRIRGSIIEGLIKTFNPVTGYIELYDPESYIISEYIQLTERQINDLKFIELSGVPLSSELVSLNVYEGVPQEYGVDYFVIQNRLYWSGTPLETMLSVGDILRVHYPTYALRDADISFTYNIRSEGIARVMDLERSRVFDRDHVFPALCYDGYSDKLDIRFSEYVNFLSDYSNGIKFTYFNKDTFQIEEHVFSGPVFETYDANEDEISSRESFPDALVKIRNPMNPVNPLNLLTNYGFINNPSIRIRKKTIRELLPDRTFRTYKITEALPV